MLTISFAAAYEQIHGVPYNPPPHGAIEDHTAAMDIKDLPPVECNQHGPRTATYLLVDRALVPAARAAYRTDLLYEDGGRLYVAAPFAASIHPPGAHVGRIAGRDIFAPPAAAVHFVGFRGDEYVRAVHVFGTPDFVHRVWDTRAVQEVAPGDTVVFARYHDRESMPTSFTFDDSGPQGLAPDVE